MWMEKTPDGKFKYRERYTDPYTEKYKTVSVTLTSDSRQAHNKAREILGKKMDGAVNEKKKEKVSFHKVVDEWYEGHRKTIRNSTMTVYTSVLKAVKGMAEEDVWISNIDALLLQTAFNKLDYSDEYTGTLKSTLNMVFEYARRMGYIESSPMNDVSVRKRAKTREDFLKLENKYLERAEAEELIKELYRRPSTYRMGRLAEFMFLTGMRIGEATAMQPMDFDLKNRLATVNGSIDKTEGYRKGTKGPVKTNASYRTIDITGRTVALVQRSIEEVTLDSIENPKFKALDYIFVTKNGVPVQNNSFNLGLKKAGARVNLENKNLSSHIFRHTHISWLAEKGYPLKAIMDRVGHEDSKVTNQIYTHVTKNMRSDILGGLEKDGL